MAPVMAGMVSYPALHDPSLSLMDWQRMNAALATQEENERRVRAWLRDNPDG